MPKMVLCGKRYLIPAHTDITVGATHWRDDEQTSIDPQDGALNYAALAELLPHMSSALPGTLPDTLVATAHWRALRASTPDRLPLVGAVPDLEFYREAYAALQHGPNHQRWPQAQYLDGLYVLGGLGSRGAGTASLCAQLLAEQIANKPGNLQAAESREFARLLHPARFLVRQLKRAPAAAADGILAKGKPKK